MLFLAACSRILSKQANLTDSSLLVARIPAVVMPMRRASVYCRISFEIMIMSAPRQRDRLSCRPSNLVSVACIKRSHCTVIVYVLNPAWSRFRSARIMVLMSNIKGCLPCKRVNMHRSPIPRRNIQLMRVLRIGTILPMDNKASHRYLQQKLPFSL